MVKKSSKKTGTSKKKKKSSVVPMIPTDVTLPKVCDNRIGFLQHTMVANDMTSFMRLCDDYNYEGDLSKTDSNNSTLLHTAVRLKNKNFLMHLLQKKHGRGYIDLKLDIQLSPWRAL